MIEMWWGSIDDSELTDDEKESQLTLPVGNEPGLEDCPFEPVSDELILSAIEDEEKERQKKLRMKKLEDGICPTCGRDLEMTHWGLVCPKHNIDY